MGRELRVTTTLFSDAGWYRCKITNDGSEVWTAPAQLVVTPGVPTWYSAHTSRKLIVPEVLQQFDSSIVLYWDEPASNGGLLADYRLEYKHDLTGGG